MTSNDAQEYMYEYRATAKKWWISQWYCKREEFIERHLGITTPPEHLSDAEIMEIFEEECTLANS